MRGQQCFQSEPGPQSELLLLYLRLSARSLQPYAPIAGRRAGRPTKTLQMCRPVPVNPALILKAQLSNTSLPGIYRTLLFL